MTETCAPPDGTKDGTWHWLVADHIDGGEVHRIYEWTGRCWNVGSTLMPPIEVASFGYRYHSPVALPEEAGASRKEIERLRKACAKMNEDVCQVLGKALGYPWFKDDQKNFPGSTEEHGVCVGGHVAESLASEAAERLQEVEGLRRVVRELRAANLAETAMVNAGMLECVDESNGYFRLTDLGRRALGVEG